MNPSLARMRPPSERSVKIAVVPANVNPGRRLHSVRLDRLNWHGDTPESGTLADLGRTEHLLAYAHRKLLWRPRPRVRAQVSVIVAEPKGIQPEIHRGLRYLWWRFFRVLTHDPELLERLPNARFLPFGTTWVGRNAVLDCSKTRNMSLIASDKRHLVGHRLRHTIADWTRRDGLDVDLLGHAYRRIETKIEGLEHYRYSVVIENERRDNYFSEKLLDAFFCDTVPIYWGAPNIGRFFDTRGMVVCQDQRELERAIRTLGAEDYPHFAEFLPANQKRADEFRTYERRAIDAIRREIEATP